MNCELYVTGETGLKFFGKMTASISHEIKNALAIINENAGLLEDITLMADRGVPMNPERLKTLAGTLQNQVRRADGVIKTMNRFAHSVDEAVKSVDLGDMVEFVAALSMRFASTKGVTLELKPPGNSGKIRTRPFFLENLVWLCLDFAMDMSGEDKNVGFTAEATENGGQIRFTKLEGLAGTPTDTFPAQREKFLLETLDGKLAIDAGAGEIVIILPRDISAGEEKTELFSKED